MDTFTLTDQLPCGTTVLEASAGTGKTFAIAALTTRFVAEGRASIGDLLLVTFSRSTTSELRLRVRERLRSSASALRCFEREGRQPADEVDALLCRGGSGEAARRCRRLEEALERFDQATIMTTHEFCHGMMRGLGVLAPQEPQSTLVEDLAPLADEAAADLYLRRYAFAQGVPPFPWRRRRDSDDPGALEFARDAVALQAELGPPGGSDAVADRVRFAEDVRAEVDARKRRLRLFSFDDQLTRLRDALEDPVTGELARTRLARRFPVVLIDEFQDTDPVQWQVIRAAFGRHDNSALVLIGDPKQAIYAFRGADVHTYTAAARAATRRTTLTRNYRSDKILVDAVAALFDGVLLGEEIDVPSVTAQREGRRLTPTREGPWAAGIQLRAIESERPATPWQAGARITDDLVGVVTDLLGPEPPLLRAEGVPLRASDIAVLVRSNRRGAAIASALSRTGVRATFSGTDSVFASGAALDWLTLLSAFDQPRRPFVQRAILTDFVGATLPELVNGGQERQARWSEWLHGWARTLRRSGVPALLAAIDRDTGFTARLLARELGERSVTDHRHLAELLHEHAGAGPAEARELGEWLAASIEEATAASERTRRLETDEAAVQIMTIHRAKGLQFPVVLLPDVSRDYLRQNDDGGPVVLPLEDGRALDVGGRLGPGRQERWTRRRLDEADESLRTLYVGMTRAQSHVVAWWANHWDTPSSPLHRVLQLRRGGEPRRPQLAYDCGDTADGGSPLTLPWLRDAGVAVVAVSERRPGALAAPAQVQQELGVRPWTRVVDQNWRRTSYSGLTAAAHAAGLEQGAAGAAKPVSDEPPEEIPVAADPALALPSPMAALPGGAAFGTVVHSVYEGLDASDDGWRDALREEVGRALRLWPLPDVDADELSTALAPTLETPLGPLAQGTTLRSFGRADRLTEFDFEFPLDAPTATLSDVAALFARHTARGDDLADYPSRLVGPTLTEQRLHGFLTGSIDAVLRLPGGGHLVVDYKTNRLGRADDGPDALTVGHYGRPALAQAMMASHYPLQALLYSVALHRHLRQRLPAYDPARDLAGTAYLFVRGMAGPSTPVINGHPTGVFSWRPAPQLVVAVSRLLAGGGR